MKVSEVTMPIVRRAIAIYLDLAYGGNTPRRLPDLSLPADSKPEEVLRLFQREIVEELPGHPCVRYSMRLGNRNYPFMKLKLQEHLVAGEFYFEVDTHDVMEIRPDFPDYEAWQAVQRFNSVLKRKIEAQLAAEGLPTAATIREICQRRQAPAVTATARTILVVDDELDLAESVESLLRARGYQVYKAPDGQTALRIAAEHRPDLMILDYELPEMDGLQVIAAIRRDPGLRGIPVLLTTASRIGVEDIRKADGFLGKPFQEDLLYKVVQRLLGPARRAPGTGDAEPGGSQASGGSGTSGPHSGKGAR
jgi:CheY-like chemotaxis protein